MNEKKPIHETLAVVAGRILEDAAFVFTDRMQEGACSRPASWEADGVSLSFTGAASGTVHLWADEGFARYAASNMLGLEPGADDAAAQGMDALKELLNIIVGNFLTEVYGAAPVFNLGIPEPLDPAALEADRTAANGVWLEAEGRALLLTVRIRGEER